MAIGQSVATMAAKNEPKSSNRSDIARFFVNRNKVRLPSGRFRISAQTSTVVRKTGIRRKISRALRVRKWMNLESAPNAIGMKIGKISIYELIWCLVYSVI